MIDHAMYGLSYVEHLSYIGTFFSVAFSGYAIPIPEELILVFGGFLSAQGISNLYAIMAVSILGAVMGDNLIYYLSSHGSRFTQKYHKKVEKSHAGWYMRHMRKNPASTIFFSRFIVGMRFLNPLVSGLMEIPWKIFFISSFLSACIYIPLIVFLGFYFHNQIHTVLHVMHSIKQFTIMTIIAGTLILTLLFFRNLIEKRS